MRGGALAVGWFWLRTSLRRHWKNYLAIVVLVGAIGGLAIGSVAAARRTASSYNVFLAHTNPSNLTLTVYAPNIAPELAKLPHVKSVAVATYSVNAFPAGKNGGPTIPAALADGNVTLTGSLDKEYVSEDKLTVLAGRLANPTKTDEFVASVNAAKDLHWHLGQTIPMDFYTDAQSGVKNFLNVPPTARVTMHLVGLVVANNQVLVDEIDQKPELVFMTPATSRLVVNNAAHYNQYALQLDGGDRELATVQREIVAALPAGTTYSFHVNDVVQNEVNRSIEPEAIALGVFGLIAGLAALIIAAGLIARTIRREGGDLEVLRALGANTAMVASASLLTLLGTIVLSAILAVAVALSPLSPIGPIRAVYPNKGISFDWAVLGIGFALVR